jgi:endonuclease-3
MLVEEFGGVVPSDVDSLLRLPGVGRKTANVLASVLYDQPAMAVDTHVFRVSNRLGLTDATNPVQSERQLMELVPTELVSKAHHWLILHGRYTCRARSPLCTQCGLSNYCRFYSDEYVPEPDPFDSPGDNSGDTDSYGAGEE